MERVGMVAAVAALLLAGACAEKGAVEERGGAGDRPAAGIVRIVFDLPGDDIGAPEDRELLREIREGITAAGAGEVVGTGFGMGKMEILVAPVVKGDLERVRRVIRERAPEARYRIEPAGR